MLQADSADTHKDPGGGIPFVAASWRDVFDTLTNEAKRPPSISDDFQNSICLIQQQL
jgi:hypothetical protein